MVTRVTHSERNRNVCRKNVKLFENGWSKKKSRF
jgi:hypothetical protein